ncbi:hypothetical protein KGQ64_08300 [bacterium]|nr:hypothetical protein [bacterium]
MADRERNEGGKVVAPVTDENKGWNAGGLLGWLALALGTLGFIWFVSHQLGAGWEGRENEAQAKVRELKLPGMSRNLSDATIDMSNEARTKGTFVGQFAWSAAQVQGPLYTVKLNWMEGSEHKRAEFQVDLENKTVVPGGPSAVGVLTQAGATQIPAAAGAAAPN